MSNAHTSMIESIQRKEVLIDLKKKNVILICVNAIKINTIFSRASSGYKYIMLDQNIKT